MINKIKIQKDEALGYWLVTIYTRTKAGKALIILADFKTWERAKLFAAACYTSKCLCYYCRQEIYRAIKTKELCQVFSV